ncbi:MAG TPA: glycerophosphodiester phosphodiesterase [Solirubrobacteraceae bacterium]|nr:glycerophosphodiester phosphodiesterase [Solirubrobacteraceae bacterium]
MTTARRPLICAHRGASADLPDNSLAAFEAAIAAGADVIETDVRQGPDGRLVLAHDPVTGSDTNLVGLDELLAMTRGRIGLDLEIKEPAAAQATCDAVRGWAGWLMITAFDPETLLAVRRHAPRLRTGLIVEAPVTIHPVRAARRCGASAILWEDELATPVALRACATEGLAAWVWTVNAPFGLAERMGDELEGIITDVPALATSLAGSLIGGDAPHG